MRTENAIEKICPRCQSAFHCHAQDIATCDCSKVMIDRKAMESLKANYHDCLCLQCLQTTAGQETSTLRAIVAVPFLILFYFSGFIGQLSAQSFPPPAGQAGTTAMHKDSAAFRAWAVNCTVVRGDMDISNTSLGKASAGDESFACGKALSNGVVSLGDGGYAVCTFASPLQNGPGPDFAVFENSFDGNFLELAFVEVSSDGLNFFRFPARSLADTMQQAGTFDNSDARLFDNLAGKYMSGYGTPFDLDELKSMAGLDISKITHIRVKDVIGALQNQYCSRDALGRKINDPWPTPFPQGGFDLDAIGLIHTSAVNGIQGAAISDIFLPTILQKNEVLEIRSASLQSLELLDLQGRLMSVCPDGKLNTGDLQQGLYLVRVTMNDHVMVQRLLIY